jgi:hypothetical protein
MELKDAILLLHPVLAIIVVFPLLGIVLQRALQTRQRRLQISTGEKSKIPTTVNQEHVQIGRWLTGSVVGIVLIALGNDVFGNIVEKNLWAQQPVQVVLVGITFGVAIASLTFLYQAKERLGRSIFATFAGISLVVIGSQDGVYRNASQWYISHYYYGIAAAILMIISLAIVREIHQDRTHRWRNLHIVLNSIALLLFLGQSITGTKSLLEVPLSWQEPYIQKLSAQQCNKSPCVVQPAPSR